MSHLEILNITKSYRRKPALRNISLSLPPSTVALLGPNGAGKTTLLRILATLIEPDSGHVRYGSCEWRDKKAVRPLIGYLPQHFHFYPYLTVRECLVYIAVLKNMSKSSLEAQIAQVLEATHLTDVAETRIRALSGGTLRRVGIAQSLIAAPKIMLVDEPTAGLDPEECIRFRNGLLSGADDRMTIISTHIAQDVEAMCQHVAVLIQGRICFWGSTSDFIHTADGYVMEADVSLAEANQLRRSHCVISEQYGTGGTTRIRYLADQASSSCVTPTVNDAYFLLMKREEAAE